MDAKCPFCGPTHEWNKELSTKLTALQAQVAAMREVVQAVADGECCTLEFVSDEVGHLEDCRKTPKMKEKAQALLSTPTDGEWVSVRREDLQKLIREFELQYPESGIWKPTPNAQEAYNRLKTALGTGGKE